MNQQQRLSQGSSLNLNDQLDEDLKHLLSKHYSNFEVRIQNTQYSQEKRHEKLNSQLKGKYQSLAQRNLFVDFSKSNPQAFQQPQTQQMPRQQVFGHQHPKNKEQQINLPSIQNSYSSKDLSLESTEKILKPSSNKVSTLNQKSKNYISRNVGSQSQLSGSYERQREHLSIENQIKQSESSLSHMTKTFESHDNAFKMRTRNKFNGSNDQFHTLEKPSSNRLLGDKGHSPHKQKITDEVKEFGSAAVVKRFQGIGDHLNRKVKPLNQMSPEGKPVGQPSPTFKLNFNFQDQTLGQSKSRNSGADQNHYQTVDQMDKPNINLLQKYGSHSLSQKNSNHQIPKRIQRKSSKASNLMASAKQIQQAALNRPIPILPKQIKSTTVHKLSLLKRNSSKKDSQLKISEQTSGLISTNSVDKIPKQLSLDKNRSLGNESEDLRTKASSILDKYRQSQVKQSASVIEGAFYLNQNKRVGKIPTKLSLDDEPFSGKQVMDLKTIIEKKERRKRSRDREKAMIQKNIQDEKYATFMGQPDEDKDWTPATPFRPMIMDPVISFLDEDMKSQAWDQQASVPTFTPVTNKNGFDQNFKSKPQVTFEDAYNDQIQRRKKSSSVEKKQKKPRPSKSQKKHNESIIEDSVMSTKKMKKVLDEDQRRRNRILKQKFKTSLEHRGSLIKQDSLCSSGDNIHFDDLREVLCQNQFKSINMSQELSEFENLNKSTDDIFEDALGKSKFDRDRILNKSAEKDEALYSQRLLPFEGQNKSVFDEFQSDSTFYHKQNASILTCIDQSSKKKQTKLMNKGLSLFTKHQNYSHTNLVNVVQLRTSLGSPLGVGSPANPYNDTDPQDLIKETHKTYKQIKSSANRLVCGQDDFHQVVNLQRQASVLNQISLPASSIQLCKNNQFSLKVPVFRRQAPIRVSFEYLDQQSGHPVSQSQLARMKGCINVFYSRIHYNPQINIAGTGSKEPLIRNQGQFIRCIPLKSIIITAKDDEKFDKNSVFECEFIFMTIECNDFDILDEILLQVKAEIIQPPQRFIRPTDTGPKPTQEQLAEGLKILQEFEDANNMWKGKSKDGLQEFKKKMYEMINRYQDRPLEFKAFEKDVRELMRKNRGQSYSPVHDQNTSVFITDQIQSIEVKDDLSYENSKSLQEAKSRLLQQLLDFGDYMEHNKLNVLYGQHDVVTRQNKYIDHNLEYNQRQEQAVRIKKQKEDDHHKMKLFLLHRKEILKQIRRDATDARIAKLRKEKKIKSLIVEMTKVNAVKLCLWNNLSALIKERTLKRYQKILCMRIERYYKKAMSCRASTVQLRIKQEMRCMLTAQTGMLIKYTLTKRAQKLLKKFITQKIGIMSLVSKIKRYSDAVIYLQTFYRKQANIETGRQLALYRLCEIIKNTIMQGLIKKASNSKNKDKLSKLVSLEEQVLQEVIDSYYSYQKLKNAVILTYQNKLRNQELCDQINEKIQKLQEAEQEQMETDGGDQITNSIEDTLSQDTQSQSKKPEKKKKLPDTIPQLENMVVSYKFLIDKANERIQEKLTEVEKLQKYLGLSATSTAKKSSSRSPPKKAKKGPKVIPLEKRALNLNIDLNLNTKLLRWGIEVPMMKKLIDLAISIQSKRRSQIQKNQSEQDKNTEPAAAEAKSLKKKVNSKSQSPNRRLSKLPEGPSPMKTPLHDVNDLTITESKSEQD